MHVGKLHINVRPSAASATSPASKLIRLQIEFDFAASSTGSDVLRNVAAFLQDRYVLEAPERKMELRFYPKGHLSGLQAGASSSSSSPPASSFPHGDILQEPPRREGAAANDTNTTVGGYVAVPVGAPLMHVPEVAAAAAAASSGSSGFGSGGLLHFGLCCAEDKTARKSMPPAAAAEGSTNDIIGTSSVSRNQPETPKANDQEGRPAQLAPTGAVPAAMFMPPRFPVAIAAAAGDEQPQGNRQQTRRASFLKQMQQQQAAAATSATPPPQASPSSPLPAPVAAMAPSEIEARKMQPQPHIDVPAAPASTTTTTTKAIGVTGSGDDASSSVTAAELEMADELLRIEMANVRRVRHSVAHARTHWYVQITDSAQQQQQKCRADRATWLQRLHHETQLLAVHADALQAELDASKGCNNALPDSVVAAASSSSSSPRLRSDLKDVRIECEALDRKIDRAATGRQAALRLELDQLRSVIATERQRESALIGLLQDRHRSVVLEAPPPRPAPAASGSNRTAATGSNGTPNPSPAGSSASPVQATPRQEQDGASTHNEGEVEEEEDAESMQARIRRMLLASPKVLEPSEAEVDPSGEGMPCGGTTAEETFSSFFRSRYTIASPAAQAAAASAAKETANMTPNQEQQQLQHPQQPVQDEELQDRIRSRIVALLTLHDPSKLVLVDSILPLYAGREDDLLAAYVAKYGPEPPSSSSSIPFAGHGTSFSATHLSQTNPPDASLPSGTSASLIQASASLIQLLDCSPDDAVARGSEAADALAALDLLPQHLKNEIRAALQRTVATPPRNRSNSHAAVVGNAVSRVEAYGGSHTYPSPMHAGGSTTAANPCRPQQGGAAAAAFVAAASHVPSTVMDLARDLSTYLAATSAAARPSLGEDGYYPRGGPGGYGNADGNADDGAQLHDNVALTSLGEGGSQSMAAAQREELLQKIAEAKAQLAMQGHRQPTHPPPPPPQQHHVNPPLYRQALDYAPRPCEYPQQQQGGQATRNRVSRRVSLPIPDSGMPGGHYGATSSSLWPPTAYGGAPPANEGWGLGRELEQEVRQAVPFFQR